MRKMKLIRRGFYNRCEVSVYDITEEKGKEALQGNCGIFGG